MTRMRCGCFALALLLFACSPSEEERSGRPTSVLDRADAFTQTMLEGYNEGDYLKFSQHFDSRLKRDLTEPVFQAMRDSMIRMLGSYKAKMVDHVEEEGTYRVVHYRMAFENETGSLFKMILQPYWDDYLISGIEFVGGQPAPPDSLGGASSTSP